MNKRLHSYLSCLHVTTVSISCFTSPTHLMCACMEMFKGKHPHSHSRWLVFIHSVSMCSYARVTERIAQTLLCNVWSQKV